MTRGSLLAVVVALLVAPVALASPQWDPTELPTIGGTAPAFGLEAFKGRGEDDSQARVVQLDDYCGISPGDTSMVLVAFVSELVVKDDFKILNQWSRKYSRDGLRIVAISTDEKPTAIADAVSKTRLPFPVLDDRYGIVAQRYGIPGPTFTLLLDSACRVLGMSDKAVGADSQRLGSAVDERAKNARLLRK